MVVIICGGRDFRDRSKMAEALDYWMQRLPITKVVHGGQTSFDRLTKEKYGTDYLAGEWAKSRNIPVVVEAVSDEEWKKVGRGAGPMRNRRMLDRHNPERVIAFKGGSGTENMLEQARGRGVKCIEVA